jgi:hypothetical protein
MIVVWADYKAGDWNIWNKWEIYAQRVDSSGTLQWGNNGLAVCVDTLHAQGSPLIVSDSKKGAIISWGDARSTSDYGGSIYAQRVGDDTLFVEEESEIRMTNAKLKVYPNPFVQSAVIGLRLSVSEKEMINIKIYDLGGRLVEKLKTQKSKVKTGGERLKIKIGKKLASGVYFVKVKGYEPTKIIKIGGVR